jgi:superfamily I DNA/RNA helicase
VRDNEPVPGGWEVVFIPAANHGHLPSFYVLHSEDDLEEEKRVLGGRR